MRAVLIAIALFAPTAAVADDQVPAPPEPPATEPAPPTTAPTATPTPAPAPVPTPAPAVAPKQSLTLDAQPMKRRSNLPEIPKPTQGKYAERPNISHTPAIIATSTTGAFVLATAVAYLRYKSFLAKDHELTKYNGPVDIQDLIKKDQEYTAGANKWKRISFWLFATTVASGGVTAYAWSRHDPEAPQGTIDPSNQKDRVHVPMFLTRIPSIDVVDGNVTASISGEF